MKNWKQLVIGLGIAAGALYYTLRNVSVDDLVASLKTVQYIYLIPMLVIIAVNYVARIYRWRALISPMKNVELWGLGAPMMIGFMGNILPGRVGEFLRPYLLAKKFDLSFSGSLATVVVERIFDILILLVLFVWAFVFHAEVFNSQAVFSGVSVQTIAVKFGQASGLLVGALMVFIYFLAFHQEKAMGWVRWFIKPLPHKWHDKIEYLFEEFALGLTVVKDLSALLRVTFWSVIVWVAIVYSYYPLYLAYNLENQSLQSLVILTVIVCIFITVLPTPAFLGSMNAGVLIALHEIMGESEIAAVSFGFAAWAANFFVIFAAGLYFILHEHLSVKQLVEAGEKGQEAVEKHE